MTTMIASKDFPYKGETKNKNERFEVDDADTARKLMKLKRATYATRRMTAESSSETVKPVAPATTPAPAAAIKPKKKVKPAQQKYKTRDMTAKD